MLKPGVSTILRYSEAAPEDVNATFESSASLLDSSPPSYPVLNGIPRFVDTEHYSESFGLEWNLFPQTQLDSANGTQISYHRFKQITGLEPSTLAGKRVLEVGCGMGRFLEVLAAAGAEVWGADMSSAVEAAETNTRHFPNCQVIQADLFNLPFQADFDLIYSFGVLHHTPDPKAAFLAIAKHLKPGGKIVVWTYGKGISSGIKAGWVPRTYQIYGPLFKVLPLELRKIALTHYTHLALAAGSIPVLGKLFKFVLPIQDLRKKGPGQDGYEPEGCNLAQREKLRFEWALCGAFDMFTPTYTRQQEDDELVGWAQAAGLVEIQKGTVPASVIAVKPAA